MYLNNFFKIVTAADKANRLWILVLGMHYINVQFNTEDILSKASEDIGLTEDSFKGGAVFQGDDFDHEIFRCVFWCIAGWSWKQSNNSQTNNIFSFE